MYNLGHDAFHCHAKNKTMKQQKEQQKIELLFSVALVMMHSIAMPKTKQQNNRKNNRKLHFFSIALNFAKYGMCMHKINNRTNWKEQWKCASEPMRSHPALPYSTGFQVKSTCQTANWPSRHTFLVKSPLCFHKPPLIMRMELVQLHVVSPLFEEAS